MNTEQVNQLIAFVMAHVVANSNFGNVDVTNATSNYIKYIKGTDGEKERQSRKRHQRDYRA